MSYNKVRIKDWGVGNKGGGGVQGVTTAVNLNHPVYIILILLVSV